MKRCGCDGLEISLKSVESHAVPHSVLPNHTEGHRLNGLSEKAELRLGKDSAGVEEYPNQDKLHKISVLQWVSLTEGRGANHITTLTCLNSSLLTLLMRIALNQNSH